jgi:translation initiation factor 4A
VNKKKVINSKEFSFLFTNKMNQNNQQNSNQQNQTQIKEFNDFEDMQLSENLLRGIYGYGFEKPSKIQQKAIVPIVSTSRDVIAQAQSGTGKTGAFTIPMLQKVDPNGKYLQGIILSPTRELSEQIFKVLLNFGIHLELNIHAFYGGNNVKEDIYILKNEKVQIVVGTPGRMFHMIQEGFLNIDQLKMIVLDEADRLLSEGFKDQIYDLFQYLPEKVQICLFSATLPPDVLEISTKFMEDPIQILIKKQEITLEGIKQFYISCGDKPYLKFDVLCDLYKSISITQCMIFVNSKRSVDELSSKLKLKNFTISSIHGGLDQQERNSILKEFRNGKTRILICTDLLARGIDVHQVSLVINYDLPVHIEDYVHRIGRSGRHGRKGVGINLLTSFELNDLKEIEKYYSTTVDPMPENFSDYFN